MDDHLIFFDRDCGFCYRAVYFLVKIDEEKRLLFAPLGGKIAQEILVGPNAEYAKQDSLILVESFRSDRRSIWARSKAVFRIQWLLGNFWVGWLCFLPNWVCDWVYRIVAKHRHRLNIGWVRPEFQGDRFLP